VNLLDGTFQGSTFQVGPNAGQTITVASVASAKSSALGTMYTAAGTAVTNVNFLAAVKVGDTGTFTVNGIATGVVTYTGVQATDLKTVAAAINSISGQDNGVIATIDPAGTSIDLSSTTSQTAAVTYAAGAGNVGTGATALATVGIIAAPIITVAGATTHLTTAGVTTVDSSNLVLSQIDTALQQLATSGAQLGAYQNRFTAAISGLNTDSTNLSSARSSIQDTDYAQATSNLSKAQILQQASTAMVAQANTIPQNILSLLQHLP
jgi:flagellin